MKQTPEIVIPAKQISCCADCPFFIVTNEVLQSADFFCDKADKIFGNSYRGFQGLKQPTVISSMWPDQDIWINCPLPDVQDKEN